MDMDTVLTAPKSKEDLLRTAHVAQLIDEQLVNQHGDTVVVDTVSFSSYFAELHGNKPQPLYRSKAVYKSGLVWLNAIGAVTDDAPYAGSDNAGNRKRLVTVDRAKLKQSIKVLQTNSELFTAKQGSSKAQLLPDPEVIVGGGFALHSNHRISYKLDPISLEPQVRRVLAYVMAHAQNGQYVSSQSIIDNCLSEQYLERAATKNNDSVPGYVRRCMSEGNSAFRMVTGSPDETLYFKNKYGVGYTFDTHSDTMN